MDLIVWIILLIPVAVWILSNLASPQKEAPPRAPAKPPPLPRDILERASRKPAEEEDKYREEIEKREKKPDRPPRERKPLPRPIPRRKETSSQLPPRPIVMPPPLPPSLPAIVLEQRMDAPAVVVISPPVVVHAQLATQATPVVTPVKPATPAIKNLLDLLKRKESLTTAFLLKEVLDLPVSKRPRRRV